MKFDCKEISISDEELGCQVTFSENKDLGAETENMSLKEIEESIGKYLLIQRSYPEDDFETHDENINGDLEDFEIILSRHSFTLNLDSEIIEISINPTKEEYAELKRVLPIIIDKQGGLIIHE
jgi:hypothetical protein